MKKNGFSLIEIIGVLGIIGVLIIIISASFRAAASSARDDKRVADLNAIAQALETYYARWHKYPYYIAADYPNCSGLCPYNNLDIAVRINGRDWLSEALKSEIGTVPLDPTTILGPIKSNSLKDYIYFTPPSGNLSICGSNRKAGSSFALRAVLEKKSKNEKPLTPPCCWTEGAEQACTLASSYFYSGYYYDSLAKQHIYLVSSPAGI
jgi:prepilin-type N-terminal cleavage/methylation domain-containing protein